MLNWCSYCQHFVGETPPYDRFGITHGICTTCEPNVQAFTDVDFAHTQVLKDIQDRLFEVGQRSDLDAARRIIDDAEAANVRGIDILLGVVAPMLYQIGEDWRRGLVTVAQEHSFTAFCQQTFDLVAATVATVKPYEPARAEMPETLLINAPGNFHTLGIRMIALSLVNKRIPVRVVDGPLGVDESVALIGRVRPRTLLISMALAEQTAGVVAIVERIAAWPEQIRPAIIVGGYAVKQGLVSTLPGADLMADISALAPFERREALRLAN